MSDLRELRALHAYFSQHPELNDELAEYCRSDEFLRQLDAISTSPAELARLTICLLGHVALCPRSGTTLESILPLPSEQAENFYVALQFNRLVNFIGTFELAVDAPEVAQLKRAVEANLASRKFKAAQMHRRLEQRNMKRFCRITKVANTAVAAFREQEQQKAPYISEHLARETFDRELRERCKALYEEVYRPLHDRLTGRVRAVGQQAFDQDYRGSYQEIMIAFTRRYLLPAS